MRFAPKNYTAEDPAFLASDDFTVMTYLSSRYENRGEVPMGTTSTTQAFTEGSKAFEKFNLNIAAAYNAFMEMGAMPGISAISAAVLLISATSLAF